MADDLFNIDIVRDFMISHGGKVRNHELVTHFKNFLSNPQFKVTNRQKFKTFVNTLATVKLDETGEKVLVLKKKFRDEENATASASTVEKSYKREPPKAKLKDSFTVRKPSEDEDQGKKQGNESLLDSIQKELAKPIEESEPVTPKPDYDDSIEEPAPDYQQDETDHMATAEPDPDYESNSKDDSEVFLEDEAQPKEPSAEVKVVAENSSRIGKDVEEIADRVVDDPKEEATERGTVDGNSSAKVVSVEDQNEKNVVKKSDPRTETKETAKPPNESEELEVSINIKDRVKQLNTISSMTNIHGSPGHTRKSYKKHDSDEGGQGMVHLDDIEREWLLMSAKADYHPMAKMLSKNPQLAKRKDFTNTALHWASKHGNTEIVKMLCGTDGVQVNGTSGYTPLHLAAMQGHEEVIEILVKVYGADTNLRDHSGKKPKQYLKNSATAHIQPSNFKRSGSYSSKINTAGHFGIKANTAMRTSWADNQRSVSRSSMESPKQSPRIGRKSSNADDFLMMPPPQDIPSRRKKSKTKSTPIDSISKGSSQDISRSGSDPMLSKSDVATNPPVHQSTSYTSFV